MEVFFVHAKEPTLLKVQPKGTATSLPFHPHKRHLSSDCRRKVGINMELAEFEMS
jgi:hypothetical protein